MSVLRVAAVQLNAQPEPERNLQCLESALQQAQAEGAQIAVLPENLLCMGENERQKFGSADHLGEWYWRDQVLQLGQNYGLALIAGSLFVHDGAGRVWSRCWVSNPHGRPLDYYDKRHLFDVQAGVGETYAESDTIAPGVNAPVVSQVLEQRWGLSICYDLRFPEHYRQLVDQGAEVLCVPAAFTATTGEAHWETLLRARAIENQCFVVAANQCGQHASGRQTWGHSMIIDPWGKILAQAGARPEVIVADFDFEQLQQLRQRFPALQHRIET